jgi:DNA-binding response OmpR family regulator
VSGERVLIVDDAADMREFIIQYVLKPGGYGVMEARDGLEALQLLSATPPDLVITDLQMPRLDGLGLLRRMKEQGITIPVVLMTFYGSEEIAIEVFRLGVRDYVIKPFEEAELSASIERALSEVRMRRHRDVLREVGKLISSLPDTDTLLNRVLLATAQLTGVPQSTIFLLSDDGRSLVQRGTLFKGEPKLTQEMTHNQLAWQAIQSAQSVASQAQTDTASGLTIIQAYLPLIVGQTCFGALMGAFYTETVTEEQYRLLESLVNYAAIGLERARLAQLLAAR